MPRFKLTLEYDGAPFVGWQRQSNGLSVQEVIETALNALCGERVTIRGAGTHGYRRPCHRARSRMPISLKDWRCDVLRDGLNAHMRPHPVAVLAAERVSEDFDARFSAVRRHYLYRIVNRRAPLTLARGHAWLVKRKLDAGAMQTAARHLVGCHDFSTFRASQCQAESPVRTLERLDVVRDGEEIQIRVSARSFLHNQVRSIAGSLEHVGSGKWTAADLRAALDARDRRRCGMVAPPEGLYLMGVDYDPLPLESLFTG